MQVQYEQLFQNSCDKICPASYSSQIGWLVVRDIVISAGRGGCGECILPPTIFKQVFNKHNFSKISNFFGSDKLYAPSTHDQKCMNKTHHHYLVKHSDLEAKNLSSKSTKMATTVCKFLKIFRGSMSPDPP